jgi:tetratricopeptide (TPR) repeat protein
MFGHSFFVLFQQAYFEKANLPVFTQARLLHLTFQFEEALKLYEKAKQDDKMLSDECVFYTGYLHWENLDFTSAIIEFSKLESDPRKNDWGNVISFFIGNSFQQTGQIEKARKYYAQIIGYCTTPALPFASFYQYYEPK